MPAYNKFQCRVKFSITRTVNSGIQTKSPRPLMVPQHLFWGICSPCI